MYLTNMSTYNESFYIAPLTIDGSNIPIHTLPPVAQTFIVTIVVLGIIVSQVIFIMHKFAHKITSYWQIGTSEHGSPETQVY